MLATWWLADLVSVPTRVATVSYQTNQHEISTRCLLHKNGQLRVHPDVLAFGWCLGRLCDTLSSHTHALTLAVKPLELTTDGTQAVALNPIARVSALMCTVVSGVLGPAKM